MDIRHITDTYAVAPQIDAGDMPELATQGFVAIICNRPDDEVGPEHASTAMAAAARAAGMTFTYNPVVGGSMGPDQVGTQARALSDAAGPTLAYCRSGTRSCFVWAFGAAGDLPIDRMIALAAKGGYDLAPVAPQLAAIAAARDAP